MIQNKHSFQNRKRLFNVFQLEVPDISAVVLNCGRILRSYDRSRNLLIVVLNFSSHNNFSTKRTDEASRFSRLETSPETGDILDNLCQRTAMARWNKFLDVRATASIDSLFDAGGRASRIMSISSAQANTCDCALLNVHKEKEVSNAAYPRPSGGASPPTKLRLTEADPAYCLEG